MKTNKIICLDAGHGGNDPGASANGMRESDIALDVTTRLGERLMRAGLTVLLSRPADTNPGINARWQLANKQQADYFVSIHVNAGRGTGAETFYFRDSSERSCRSEGFAHYVNNQYADTMGLHNRGVKPDTQAHRGAIGVLRHTHMPAILLELAFIDSPANNPDVNILRNRRDEMVDVLADAMLDYFDIEDEREELPLESSPSIAPVLTMDVLGTVQDIGGYIDNGVAMVRLTDIAPALGYIAVWDGERRIPVIVDGVAQLPEVTDETAATAYQLLEDVGGEKLLLCMEEVRTLRELVHWEARGEDEIGQILVANVVFNRLRSPNFPNSIHDVIFQPGAFTPVKRPEFDYGVVVHSPLTNAAVNRAIGGADYSQGATFFHALSSLTPGVWHERAVQDGRLVHLFDHGGHRFYKEA